MTKLNKKALFFSLAAIAAGAGVVAIAASCAKSAEDKEKDKLISDFKAFMKASANGNKELEKVYEPIIKNFENDLNKAFNAAKTPEEKRAALALLRLTFEQIKSTTQKQK
ncbi:Vmc-like lipoprotein signal peptide domain-containing protein [Ureaplasma diversum]|uniref:Lipoprotein n=1 Tax=Ureaplasma diversum NCTC 246 TaxID=1188241 RepID=A0A084F065_9BACT|nr:hypothetical protein [Ureaplasma diversum]KEZ23607.1 Hypothetical protein, predicted lipoprotein [Ureaplasma diversum NCTC 246]